jgi:hypothetical protein
MRAGARTWVGLLAAAIVAGCDDGTSDDAAGGGDAGGGASATSTAQATTASAATTAAASTNGATGSMASSTTGVGGGVPEYASFHLNYTQDKDWSKCAERDFVVFDMSETPAADIAQCQSMGARMLCYFSSQYEEWREDAGDFGALGDPIDGWPGELWVDPDDPANLAVMIARLDVAVSKGCDGIDLDNIDETGHETYISTIFQEARARGLLVSQKNAIEKIELFWDLVDMYQNEECQQFDECEAYEGLGRPVHNIEYTPCQTLPYLYSHRKDVEAMDAWEEPCAP